MTWGGRSWYKGGGFWDNPDHCYADCISRAVNAGATDAECDQTVVLATRWVGYK
jgi:hypothetical protein